MPCQRGKERRGDLSVVTHGESCVTKFSSAALLPADVMHVKHRRRRLQIAWKICPVKGTGTSHHGPLGRLAPAATSLRHRRCLHGKMHGAGKQLRVLRPGSAPRCSTWATSQSRQDPCAMWLVFPCQWGWGLLWHRGSPSCITRVMSPVRPSRCILPHPFSPLAALPSLAVLVSFL